MITKKEIEAVELSPTKRDFYQIWNELIDTASKLSNRWDPSSTNESDPGIVLLKVLTAVADKLNYTIDKNVLEAFMPSAAQEESMRKLCDMMGYSMKYYRSATCPVRIAYVGTDYDLDADGMTITVPKYTNIKNTDEDVNYVTLEADTLDGAKTYITVDAIEGEHVSYDPITRDQLDDDRRYYLPEAQIAENGIFLAALDERGEATAMTYEKVDNLNSQDLGTRCWKFGYDSKEGAPYIEFPSDIDTLIGKGIALDFIRTSGANGNVSAGSLCKISADGLSLHDRSADRDDTSKDVTCEDGWLTVTNTAASMNGSDKETMDEAYDAYKKTIGTFDTLVTCRDYMNKIYSLTEGDIDGSSSTTPLVSNVIVSDIRDDVNRSAKVVTFGENGKTTKIAADEGDRGIDHFDLMVYPFKRYYGVGSANDYVNSFGYTTENLPEIKAGIAECKTMSHDVISPTSDELAIAKDVISVNAKITATDRLSSAEQDAVIKAAKGAIYENFNMRKLDFGEEITDDAITKAIKDSDSRVKNVWLSTSHALGFQAVGGTTWYPSADDTFPAEQNAGDKFYLGMVAKNVLAGRVPLFEYDESFEPSLNESKCASYLNLFYPINDNTYVTRIDAAWEPKFGGKDYTLQKNQVVQFRAPSFKTTITYPAYVNYFICLNDKAKSSGRAAKFKTLAEWLDETNAASGEKRVIELINSGSCKNSLVQLEDKDKKKDGEWLSLEALQSKFVWLFTRSEETGTYSEATASTYTSATYILSLQATGSNALGAISNYVKKQPVAADEDRKYSGLYRSRGVSTDNVAGQLITAADERFAEATAVQSSASSKRDSRCAAYDSLYVQDVSDGKENNFGLGIDGEAGGIAADEEYALQEGEYLLINYTNTTTDESGTETSTVINKKYPETSGETIVIRPNFQLADSATVHTTQSTSYSKKTGFSFSGTSIEGMFTMDANQQIEIREKVEVDLGPSDSSNSSSAFANVYWYRTDDDAMKREDKYIDFDWDEDPIYKEDGSFDYFSSYTLKENEYFFYTDKNKSDLAYYGNGTKIVRNSGDVNLRRWIEATNDADVDEILQYGLAANIPWISKNFTRDKKITIKEYQYVNLTEGCTLTKGSADNLTRSWTDVNADVKYRTSAAGEEKELGKITVGDDKWQVRSILQLDLGPKKAQTLHENETIAIYSSEENDEGTGWPIWEKDENGNITGFKEEQKFEGGKSVSLKSSVAVQSSAAMTLLTAKGECRFKAVTINEESGGIGAGGSSIGNYGDGMTSASFDSKNENGNSDKTTLHLAIPTGKTGLMMVYVKCASDTRDDKTGAFFKVTAAEVREYNKDESYSAEVSWTDDGMKVLEFSSKSVDVTLKLTSDKVTVAAVFSNLDVVNGINKKLRLGSGGNAALLEKLKGYDDFWYNCLIDSGEAIELNADYADDDMKNVSAWYDSNNVCNKFFIAQIDASQLDGGITIDGASKRS